MLQDQVVLIGELQNQAMFLTVCRNTGDSILKSLLRTLIENIFAKHGDFSGFCFPKSGQHLYQLRLSVAVYTCQANDLAASDIQVEAFQNLDTTIILCMKIFNIQNNFTRILVFFVNFKVYITAYHHGCQLIFIDICYLHRLNVFTLTDNGTVIRGSCDLFQLMGNKDNALAICGQIVNDLHQALDLLGCQGSGRLVEDQCFRSTVQNLQDLHTLLHADGNILYLCIRINLHTITLGQLHDLLSRCLLINGKAFGRLHTKDDVLGHRKGLDQHEMLVYHTDSDINGVFGTVKMNFLLINKNLSAGRFIQTAEYVHHGTLSGSVLS